MDSYTSILGTLHGPILQMLSFVHVHNYSRNKHLASLVPSWTRDGLAHRLMIPFFCLLISLCIALPLWLQDHDVCRGNPLYLSEARYAGLTYLVSRFYFHVFIMMSIGTMIIINGEQTLRWQVLN